MMASADEFRNLALALPGCVEKSHFGKADFRIRNKIFAGFTGQGMAHVKLRPEQQDYVCESEVGMVRPIKGGWGNQGWTEIDYTNADVALLKSLLNMAWANVAPKSMLKLQVQTERD